MAINYPRTTAQRTGDFSNARANEELVGSWLPEPKQSFLNSTTEMDWEAGEQKVKVDIKEKNQPLTAKWPLPPKTIARDAFIIDELSVRRAMLYTPNAYFVLHDKPQGRWFLARIDEVVCSNRVSLDRIGPNGHAKGKWVCDLKSFREMKDPATQIWEFITKDAKDKPWLKSACIAPQE